MRKKSLLWEIRFANLDLAGYLFGTIHINHPDVNSKLDLPLHLLDSVDCLFLEVNPGEWNKGIFKPNEDSLHTLDLKSSYSDRKYNRLKKNLTKFCGLNPDHFRRINPVILMSYIETSLSNASLDEGMDMKLFSIAVKKGIPVQGLISLTQEYESMQQLNDHLKGSELYSLSKNLNTIRKNIQHLINQYKEEDIHQLYRISKKPLGAMRKPLLFERNFKMHTNLIQEIQMERKIMAAVGAGHLSGEFGLIRLLRKSGLKLFPYRKKE
ncbi:MAG: TraB/GumN family protein [Saprospirales bacterium]|nr:MAG: TraB/GumN family protein [Saprospirales bacterium]